MGTKKATLGARALGAVMVAAALCASLTVAAEAAPGKGKGKPGGGGSTTPTTTCGTTTVYKSTGEPWVCTFADDFSGTALDTSKWIIASTALTGYTNKSECYTNDPKNVSVGNGVLSLTIRREPAPFTCVANWGSFQTDITSGYVSSGTKFAQTYGRFEIRAKFPAATVPGLQSALWLWPVDQMKYGAWPSSGEIDIAEFYTQYPDRVIPFIHYNHGGTDPNVTNNYCLVDKPSEFHTYVLEWTTQSLKITFDGKTCIESFWSPVGLVKPAPFDHPFFINLTQLIGQGGNAPTSATPFPSTMQIDYVRVWK